ncbi:MAG TPA: maleylpyruvate isomerase N-terminal domain-containing protein [Chloroflexota bacterium]|nr:maleylpyruvate isomerase N-terminal domain-containing protein [Chloroflexota bacterium]
MSVDQSIVERNRVQRERLVAVVGRLSDDQLRTPLGEDWTVAVALAHLAFWDRRVALALDRFARDRGVPAPVDVDLVNDALLAEWLALPPREAARLAVEAAERVDRSVEATSADLREALVAAGSPIRLGRAEHRQAHLDQIEQAIG